jgi:hypothetical protein
VPFIGSTDVVDVLVGEVAYLTELVVGGVDI